MSLCQCVTEIDVVPDILCQSLEEMVTSLIPHGPVANKWSKSEGFLCNVYFTCIHSFSGIKFLRTTRGQFKIVQFHFNSSCMYCSDILWGCRSGLYYLTLRVFVTRFHSTCMSTTYIRCYVRQ